MSIQTHGTCWFHAILNGLMLSDGGKKLLFEKMTRFYSALDENKKRNFINDNISTGSNTFKFYKFFHPSISGFPFCIKKISGNPQL